MIISMIFLAKDSEHHETCSITLLTKVSFWDTGRNTSSSDDMYNSLSCHGMAGKLNPTPEVYEDGYHYFG